MEIFVASKVIILHPEQDKMLLVKRSMEHPVGYELAGGRVEIDFNSKKAENLEQCIVREAYEELGVQIESLKYKGSYYFFWTVKEDTCSICAVFLANVYSIKDLKQKSSESCGDIFPVWVKIDDILDNKIFIEEHHIGLLKIIKDLALEIKNGTYP